jgi:hypothetical protein
VQRLVFPATIDEVTIKFDTDGALVATSRALWGLGPKGGSRK